ncbi:MAG: hypothetical protein VCD00_14395, partial [Candidatus Hydrogenedentota bacterium]
ITCVGNISTERVENANTNLTDRTNAPQSEVISSMDSFVLEFEASTILRAGQEVDLVQKANEILKLKLVVIDY